METSQFDLFASGSSNSAAETPDTPDQRFALSPARQGEEPLVALAGGAICLVGSENDRRAAQCAVGPNQRAVEASNRSMSDAQHRALFAAIQSEETSVTPEAVRDCFERLVRDRELVLAELGKLTVKDLLERLHGEYVYDRRKPALLERVYDNMLTSFLYLMASSSVISIRDFTQAGRIVTIRAKLAELTGAHLEAYRTRIVSARRARQERLDAYREAIKEPRTLADFTTFIEVKGKASLTVEQAARYEELVAESMLARSPSGAASCPPTSQVRASTSSMELVETRHTREGYDLFVVKIIDRVASDRFNQLRDGARACGGWYSSFRRDGAVPGFQFKVKANAQRFMTEYAASVEKQVAVAQASPSSGDAIDTAAGSGSSQNRLSRTAEEALRASQKLRAQAAKLREWSALSMGRRRLTNTPRRARMASNADEIARKDGALADTLDNLANAIAQGQCKFLARVTEKIQVIDLSDMIVSAKHRETLATPAETRDFESRMTEKPTAATVGYVDYPLFRASHQQLIGLAEEIAAEPGLKRRAAQLMKIGSTASESGHDAVVPNDLAADILDKLPAQDRRVPWQWPAVAARQKRLQRMGVTCVEQLRSACRELLVYQGHAAKADAATEMERQLVGSKVGVDFFPTPKALAKRMVEIATARLAPDARVLEPEAGNGNIAEVLREVGFEPDVVELSSSLRDILAAKGFKIIGNDFLEVQGAYDAIVMNPPFGDGADIVHVRHAWSLLAPGGCIVAIVGEGAFGRSDRAAVAFRDWLEELGATQERLPAGTFMDRSLLVTTSANARLVTIHRA